MHTAKFRWSKVYESSEEELQDYLAKQSTRATRITASLNSKPLQYKPPTDSTIWCAEGSLTLHIDTQKVSLQPGDAIRLSAQCSYELLSGISGYVCYVSS